MALSAQVAVVAFLVFVVLYGVRTVLSEWTWAAPERPTSTIRALDVGAVLAALELLGALVYQVVDFAVSAQPLL
jgi:hypothetical protein